MKNWREIKRETSKLRETILSLSIYVVYVCAYDMRATKASLYSLSIPFALEPGFVSQQ